nr:cytochrome P450 CYP6BW23 [Dendroctonus valens]
MLTYIVIALVTLFIYVKWQQSYWERRGVPSLNFHFFFGHLTCLFFGRRSIGEMTLDRYSETKKLGYKHAGFYYFWKPVYIPIDPTIIKHIMQQDSNHFSGHGMYHHPKDILSMHLFALEGERWRELRAKLTPAFTSGKIKMMFETVAEKTEDLKRAVDKLVDNEDGIAIKEICGDFTTDVIASCGFGTECDSLTNPNNVFRIYGKKMIAPKLATFLMEVFIPWNLLGNLGFKETGRETSEFFINIVRQTIQSREQNEIYRNDFMHLLLQLKNHGTLSDCKKIDAASQKSQGVITEEDIMAQCFVFFLAGFETSSTNMTFALLELAQHLDIQEKLRQEVDRVLAKHNGKFTYQSVAEMHYLEMVVNETLRKFPPVPIIPRICTQTYQLPNSNVVIEKGTSVEIPVWGIHMDPDYYPDPDVFDPERFTEENKTKRKEELTFLPFGAGPRLCIGLRFGMLQSKVGLATLIRNFKFTLNKKTSLPLEMEHGVCTNTVKGSVWLNAIRIE